MSISRSKLKYKLITAIVILTVVVGAIGLYRFSRSPAYIKESVPVAVNIEAVPKITPVAQSFKPIQRDIPKAVQKVFPKEINLAMTFYSQAPFIDWNEPWQNACEEASILLVANTYYKHNWSKEEFRDQILKMVEWENEMFGFYKSTNAQEMTKILENFLKLKSVIHQNPTFSDVQNILNKGHLIIVPLNGRELKNPFFTNGGPDYHVLVIKGYKEGEKVITSDVGTQHGENYVYTWKTITNANHDYTTPINNGDKLIIEVIPPSQK